MNKSAEVIVVGANKPRQGVEDSQTNEGPNPEEERGRQLGGLKCDKERLGNWSSLIIK